ncbi:MAG: cupin domain-containing protein [Proteobacteria bacterium]|nr:cupin domain-containing protein [Pseudomonadota bacterium]MDA1059194.1 cupin domain-containing protein [Pseudomonadota bacterium]
MSQIIHSRRVSIADSPPGPEDPPTLSLAALTPQAGSADIAVIRQIAPPGIDGPLHSHDRDEVLIMLEGALQVEANGGTIELLASDAALLPAKTTHQLRNAGAADAQWMIVSRAGLRFFLPDGAEVPAPPWAQ